MYHAPKIVSSLELSSRMQSHHTFSLLYILGAKGLIKHSQPSTKQTVTSALQATALKHTNCNSNSKVRSVPLSGLICSAGYLEAEQNGTLAEWLREHSSDASGNCTYDTDLGTTTAESHPSVSASGGSGKGLLGTNGQLALNDLPAAAVQGELPIRMLILQHPGHALGVNAFSII